MAAAHAAAAAAGAAADRTGYSANAAGANDEHHAEDVIFYACRNAT
jgi:hypothetical protein